MPRASHPVGPGTAIQAFDQDVWAATGRYAEADPRTLLALFLTLREANLALGRALTPEEWDRAGLHAERGRESVRDVAAYYAGHDLDLLAQIEAILGRVPLNWLRGSRHGGPAAARR